MFDKIGKFDIYPQNAAVKKITPYKKAIRIALEKHKNISGYRVTISPDKNFKKGVRKKNINNPNVFTVQFKRLKPNTKYYIKYRVYKEVNGKKYWSKWSSAKRVKTLNV